MTARAIALITRAMNAGPTVPSGDVRGMLIALGHLGFDTDALMRDIGLSPALRDDPMEMTKNLSTYTPEAA